MDLQDAAKRAMLEQGFEPDFPPSVQAQLAALRAHPPRVVPAGGLRDLRGLAWSSIDNDSSRDLDQLEAAEPLSGGAIKVLVAIADVDAFVPKETPIDHHASIETTTVYTGVRNFPMLPEALSTDATSLVEGADKLSVVVEFEVAPSGTLARHDIYRAVVCNRARLTYDAVGAWLEGRGPLPDRLAASSDLQAQVRLQDAAAQALARERASHGALNIETIEMRPIVSHDQVTGIVRQQKNRATELIEDFMIAVNGIVARVLEQSGRPSIRRVVRAPKRWDRIAEIAAAAGTTLPPAPDAGALNAFLTERRAADPDHFADLSLTIIKLIGSGEYVVDCPGDPPRGHFGLAVQDYTHSTAPNRRFADLVTQRLVKSILANGPAPYSGDELTTIARNCTVKEDAARKVERQMSKRIAAVAMSHRIGEIFSAIVTGVTPHGTFVRVINPHLEGLLVQGAQGVDVGDKLRVALIRADVARGYLDFARR